MILYGKEPTDAAQVAGKCTAGDAGLAADAQREEG